MLRYYNNQEIRVRVIRFLLSSEVHDRSMIGPWSIVTIDRIVTDLALKVHVTQDPSKIQQCIVAVKPVNCFSVENCVFGHLRSGIWHAYQDRVRDARTQMR